MNLFKPKALVSLLGLSFYGRRVSAIVLIAHEGRIEISKKASAHLSSEAFTSNAEIVAKELRSFLDQNELRQTKCIVCLPANRILTSCIDIPPLSEEDRRSYLDLQIETEFPLNADELCAASLPYETDSGWRAMLTAFPKHHFDWMDRVLHHAKLRPISFTLGITAIPDACSAPQLFVSIGTNCLELCVKSDSGFENLRSLDAVFETNFESNHSIHPESLHREIKITLGQLPAEIRDSLKEAILLDESSSDIAETMERQLCEIGLASKRKSMSTLHLATAAFLRDQKSRIEFLPPKENRLAGFAKKISSRGNVWLGGSIGMMAILVAIAFFWQGHRLQSLEKQWAKMSEKVSMLETLQTKIRQFRPWFDESPESLKIARTLSQAFPKEGTIWIRSLRIEENARVFCSGLARHNAELLSAMDALRARDHISEVKLQHSRGEAPIEFAFHFEWKSET